VALAAPEPAAPAAAPPVALVLRAALPIDSAEENFQPSGLLFDRGHLLTVSDKHDRTIYRLELSTDVARAIPFVVFEPPSDEPAPLDYEGLSASESGGWLISSESSSRVLEVSLGAAAPSSPVALPPLQGRAFWRTPSLRDVGRDTGCLGVPNAGLEGILLLPEGGLLLAAERDPRALIELGASGGAAPRVELMESSAYPLEPGRGFDFTDLTRSGERVYALARNAHLIVRLQQTSGEWREGAAFSYRASENDPRYRYQSRTYGLAEGVAVGEGEVFVIMDNNGQARDAARDDRRPILFVFDRPAAF
jgi:hypothetical protein